MTSTKNKGPLLFLDSGAHSLYVREVIKKGKKGGYGFFKTKEFQEYVDGYATFVLKHLDVLDYYANVDVIFDPELSWKTLKYLEKEYGLHPVPVIHYGTDFSWIKKHLDAGYEFLGIGGVGQRVSAASYIHWADSLFECLCPGPSHLPIVRTHGFAMTSLFLLRRYPWWSVDSASWEKTGAFGSILVPDRRDGKWDFIETPWQISVSEESPAMSKRNTIGRCIQDMNKDGLVKKLVLDWLEEIKIPVGSRNDSGETIEKGVTNYHVCRKQACLYYFDRFVKTLPEWPWPFHPKESEGGIWKEGRQLAL